MRPEQPTNSTRQTSTGLRPRAVSDTAMLASLALNRLLPARGVPILCYHDVGDGDALTTVSAATFRAQMELLRSWGIGVLSLGDLIGLLRARQPLRRRQVVLTFDDGYASVHREVAGILLDLSFTASVFLPVDQVGRRPDWEARSHGASECLLSWPQVMELAESGISFYPHGLTHRRLTRLPDEELHRELCASRDKLSARLGSPANVFCYPYGDCDERVRKAAASAGYEAACGTTVGVNGPGTDPWNLHRMLVLGTTNSRGFRARVTGAFRHYARLRRRVRGAVEGRPENGG